MKNNSTLLRLTVLCLLAFAGSLQAGNSFDVTVTILPPAAHAIVTGAGQYGNGGTATLTASTTNDCYVFTGWTKLGKTVSTNNPYIFSVTNNEALTAEFALLEYTILTSSSPTNGGLVLGGGRKGCGSIATLTPVPHPGFEFTDWTVDGGPTPIQTKILKFQVDDNEFVTAHFKDIAKPTLTITAPSAGEKFGQAGFAIEGTAKDNVAVAAVYFDLNGAGWQLASTVNNFAFWYAYVTLKPDTNNTLSAYAVDTSTNYSTTNTVKFTCAAAGLAPLAIAGKLAILDEGTNASDTNYVSFDSAAYELWNAFTNVGSEVGTYTYTPTGPDTAELVPQRILPTQDMGTNVSTLELTFSDAYTAAYTNHSGGSGTFHFEATEQSVPAVLDGFVAVETSRYSSDISTNTFGSATFSTEDNQGGSSSGSYTFTKFTALHALLEQTYTSPPSMVGNTNYQFLMFTEGASPPWGYYSSIILSPSGGVVSLDAGSFTTTSNAVTTKFLGLASLSGWEAKVAPEGEAATFDFTRTFGNGTFASMYVPPGTNLFLFTNGPNDVGIMVGNTRVTTNTGEVTLTSLAPPYILGKDDSTDLVTWKTSASGISSNLVNGEKGVLTLTKLTTNVPVALTGHKITATEDGKAGTYTFSYNIVTGGGSAAGNVGTYTYAPYTPTMALAKFTSTAITDAGEVQYVLLKFTSAVSGTFVNARPDVSSPTGWILRPGTFVME
jgi:hypothetical protein